MKFIIRKKIIIIFIIIIFTFTIRAEYIPDPILLVHGRGAHGSDWENVHNGHSTKSFLKQYFPNNKGIYNYSFSDSMELKMTIRIKYKNVRVNEDIKDKDFFVQ